MKKYVLILVAGLIAVNSFCQIPLGQVLENVKMESRIMKKDVRYAIYLPPDYETSQRDYPVVYLLHGFTGNETDWVQFGSVSYIADQAIASGEITPMIIVTPDGRNDWYLNSYDGKVRWEDMFVEEFIPFIEDNYRIRSKKEFRAISGLSMGGYGSLVLALRHPELFAVSAPLSAGIFTDEEFTSLDQELYDKLFGNLFGGSLEGDVRLTDHYKQYSTLEIVENTPADSVARVKFYIDCGDDDFLTAGNSELHILMSKKEIPHEYRVRDGDHSWSYWRKALPDALKFISDSFIR